MCLAAGVSITSLEQRLSGKRGNAAYTTVSHSTSSLKAGGDLSIVSLGDLTLAGVEAKAGSRLSLTAMGDVTLAPVENSLELKDHAKKSRLDIYELDSIVTSLSAGSDVSITAGGGATLIGTDIDSGGKVRIAAENDVVLAAAQDIYSYERETKSGNWFRRKQTRESETRVTNAGTDISANGDIEVVSAAGNLVTAGSRFASTEGNVALKAVKGDIFAGTYTDIFRTTHESRKSFLGGLFSSNSRSLTDNRFATGTAALAGLDLTLVSGGDTTLVGTQLKAGGRLSVETGGDFSVTAAISSMKKEYFSHRVGAVTMTTITENSFKEIATAATLLAGGGISFDIAGKASLTLYDYAGVDSKELRTLYPEELLKIAGLELLRKPLANEYFYDKKVALSPAFKALAALIVSTFVAPGIVGAVAPNLSGAMLTAAEGFTSSFLVGSLHGAVSGKFDIGSILKDATFAGVTAGLTEAINISDFIKLPKGMTENLIPGFGNRQLTMTGILDAGLDGVISSGLSSAVYGTDFGTGVLNTVVTYIANGMASAAIGEVSDKLGHSQQSIEKLVAKAAINCIAAKAKGADCAAGAIGSLVTDLMVSGISDPSKADVEDLRNRIKLVSAIAGYFTSGGRGQNVNAAVDAAVLDYKNNFEAGYLGIMIATENKCTAAGISEADCKVLMDRVLKDYIDGQARIGLAMLELVIDLMPLIGDAKGVYECLDAPSKLACGAAAIGIVPLAGDGVKILLKKGDDVISVVKEGNKVVGSARATATEIKAADAVANSTGFDELAKFREELGLPSAGSAADKSTLAVVEVNGQKIYGINAHDQPVTGVNAISRTHAEIDALNQIKQSGINVTGRDLILYVDRTPCSACGPNGGIRSMVEQLGLNQLTIISPGGLMVITPR